MKNIEYAHNQQDKVLGVDTEENEGPVHALEQAYAVEVIQKEHVFWLFRGIVDPLVDKLEQLNQRLGAMLRDMERARTFVDTPVSISGNVFYEVDYHERRFLFLWTPVQLTLATVSGAWTQVTPAYQWTPIILPRGAHIVAQGVADIAPQAVIIRACDELISTSVGAGANIIGNVGQAFLNPTGTLEILHDNQDGITVQQLNAVGPGTYQSATQSNPNARGVLLCINITAIAGAGTLTVTIVDIDPVSGATLNILASAALGAVGKTFLLVYPGIAAAANASANSVISRSWAVSSVEAGAATTVTATISAAMIL